MRRAPRDRQRGRSRSLLVVHLGAVGHDLLERIAMLLGRLIVLVLLIGVHRLVGVDRLLAHVCPLPPTPAATTARRCARARRASSRRRARAGSARRSDARTRAGCWGSPRRTAPSAATPPNAVRDDAVAVPPARRRRSR